MSAAIAIFGTLTTRIMTCSEQTIMVTTRIASDPNNQILAVETASFVANLFYDGPDDPFATPRAGGEAGKLTHVVLRKGEKLFGEALTKIIGRTEKILITSQKWKSSQIQQGARAIDKKTGHAEAKKTVTEFSNIKPTQQNAEKLIQDIINDADAIVIRRFQTKIYRENGQGLAIATADGKFIGFVERALEKEL